MLSVEAIFRALAVSLTVVRYGVLAQYGSSVPSIGGSYGGQVSDGYGGQGGGPPSSFLQQPSPEVGYSSQPSPGGSYGGQASDGYGGVSGGGPPSSVPQPPTSGAGYSGLLPGGSSYGGITSDGYGSGQTGVGVPPSSVLQPPGSLSPQSPGLGGGYSSQPTGGGYSGSGSASSYGQPSDGYGGGSPLGPPSSIPQLPGGAGSYSSQSSSGDYGGGGQSVSPSQGGGYGVQTAGGYGSGGGPPSGLAQPPSYGGYDGQQLGGGGSYGGGSPDGSPSFIPQPPGFGPQTGGCGGTTGVGCGNSGGGSYGGQATQNQLSSVPQPPGFGPQTGGCSGGACGNGGSSGGCGGGAGCGTTSGLTECPPYTITSFIRIAQSRLTGPALVVSGGDDVTCAQFCANNIEPFSGAPMSCASFNFDGRQSCYFFDNAATPAGSGILAPNAASSNYYLEKVCLSDVTTYQACTYRSHSFNRIRNRFLAGFVRKSIQAADRSACLSACLTEESFVCRSVNFNYNTYFCELSDQDLNSKPLYTQDAYGDPIDYFSNNCLTRQNRCGIGGNLIFVKTTDFEIHYFDQLQSLESSESACLQRCLDSTTVFCRSVEFSRSNYRCVISDEDTFSRANEQGAPLAGTVDYYEPVCVASDLSSSTCRQQAAFTRVIGQQFYGSPIATAKLVTATDCIGLCFQNLDCQSLNYDRTTTTCYVYNQKAGIGQQSGGYGGGGQGSSNAGGQQQPSSGYAAQVRRRRQGGAYADTTTGSVYGSTGATSIPSGATYGSSSVFPKPPTSQSYGSPPNPIPSSTYGQSPGTAAPTSASYDNPPTTGPSPSSPSYTLSPSAPTYVSSPTIASSSPFYGASPATSEPSTSYGAPPTNSPSPSYDENPSPPAPSSPSYEPSTSAPSSPSYGEPPTSAPAPYSPPSDQTPGPSGPLQPNSAVDYYEYHCDSQFGGVALCTNQGIKFIVNTKEPYTGAIYAADNFINCNQVVTNARQITLTFPPPTVTKACGTKLENGKLSATVVVSLDGVLPHQVTTEWDKFYYVTCDTNIPTTGPNGTIEGSVVVTTLFEASIPDPIVLPVATPDTPNAELAFVDSYNNNVTQAYIGDDLYLVIQSSDASPQNMMVMDCVATPSNLLPGQVAFPFKVVDNGCPTYPALVGPITIDAAQNRLVSRVKAFRLDGSYYIQISCIVMFCAGAQGCPASNCLDSAYNNVFQSQGRKKREENASEPIDHRTAATSSQEIATLIRVLARGEHDSDPDVLAEKERSEGRIRSVVSLLAEEEYCLAESTFISAAVSMSLLCVVFGTVVVMWCWSKVGEKSSENIICFGYFPFWSSKSPNKSHRVNIVPVMVHR